LADVSFRATLQAFSSPVKNNAVNTQTPGAGVGIVEGYSEIKNVFKNAPEITFWGGDRFYDRYNIDSEDYFWLNTSGFGVGAYNIHLGPGNRNFMFHMYMRAGVSFNGSGGAQGKTSFIMSLAWTFFPIRIGQDARIQDRTTIGVRFKRFHLGLHGLNALLVLSLHLIHLRFERIHISLTCALSEKRVSGQ